jgi:hypothetical protein
MNLTFEFLYNNDFIELCLDIVGKNCDDIIKYISKKYNKDNNYINIYENDNLLKKSFNNWKYEYNYIVVINKCFVNIIIKYKSKIIKLPQLEITTRISDIKNILSIEGDIFFKNKKLNNKATLEFYKIKNNNVLTTYQAEVTTSAL